MVKTVEWWQQLQARIAARLGASSEPESASVLRAVAAHREYWRPEKVRVLLLAKSHVMTREAEVASGLSLAGFGHPGSARRTSCGWCTASVMASLGYGR